MEPTGFLHDRIFCLCANDRLVFIFLFENRILIIAYFQMKDHIFSANDRLIFTNDRMQLGSVTSSHDRIHYQDRILYSIVFLITK